MLLYPNAQAVAREELDRVVGAARLATLAEGAAQIEVPRFTTPVPQEANETISQAWLWPRMGKFFRSGDVIVAETGTSVL